MFIWDKKRQWASEMLSVYRVSILCVLRALFPVQISDPGRGTGSPKHDIAIAGCVFCSLCTASLTKQTSYIVFYVYELVNLQLKTLNVYGVSDCATEQPA